MLSIMCACTSPTTASAISSAMYPVFSVVKVQFSPFVESHLSVECHAEESNLRPHLIVHGCVPIFYRCNSNWLLFSQCSCASFFLHFFFASCSSIHFEMRRTNLAHTGSSIPRSFMSACIIALHSLSDV